MISEQLIKIFIATCSLTLICCKGSTQNQEHVDEFEKIKDSYRADFTDHFPLEKGNAFTYDHQPSSEFGNIGLKLEIGYNSDEIDSLIHTFQGTAKAVYSAGDSCLLVVNRFARINDYGYTSSYKSEMARPSDCDTSYLPILNFWNHNGSNSNTSCRLDHEYYIYVLNAKSGEYITDPHRYCGRNMPKTWRHGFSKGVAITKKNNTVIYWLVIW